MRNALALFLLGAALGLGILTMIDGRYDGRTILALFLIALAFVVHVTAPKGNS